MRTPDYVLNEDHHYFVAGRETKVLPAGAFVRPIHLSYVPKHIIERAQSYNPTYDVFVYCRYGIIAIPRSIMRET